MISQYDKNNDNKITFDEFLSLMARQIQASGMLPVFNEWWSNRGIW